MNPARKIRLAAVLLLLAAALPGCKTTTDKGASDPFDSLAGRYKEREARRNTAAAAALASGRTGEALARYRVQNENHPGDPEIAVNYAQLLRKTGEPEAAKAALEKIMTGKAGARKGPPPPIVRNEYAATLIALGEYERAEDLLNATLADTGAAEYHNDARDLLGVSLDARGEHREAESQFRLALENWKGDPSPVMNNLALCLASLGRFDESLLLLRQALVISPDKEEIARNVEVVNALREKIVRKPKKT